MHSLPRLSDTFCRGPAPSEPVNDDEEARNTGSNLFVTGIHPRLSEQEVSAMFEKYGDVERTAIMLDPHTKESRGFGFVKMATGEQADAAKEGLQGETIEGRTLSIEKARRNRPRTPTPGQYYGPPKREFGEPRGRGGFRGGFREDDRYGTRGYGGRRDDYSRGYGGGRYEDRGERGYPRRDDYGPRGTDRYASSRSYEDRGYSGSSRGYGGSRDDRYGGEREDRRGGGYDRRGGGGYGEQSYSSRYDDRRGGDDREDRR